MVNKIEATIFYMMEPLFSDVIEKTFKQLLDTKHLYQNLKVDFPQFETVFKSITPKLMSRLGHILKTVNLWLVGYTIMFLI